MINWINKFYTRIFSFSIKSIAEGKETPSSQIRKLYAELQRITGETEKENLFFQEVRHFAMYSILVSTREPVVEKTIKFIAGLCTYPAGIKDREKKEKENQKNGEGEGKGLEEDCQCSASNWFWDFSIMN